MKRSEMVEIINKKLIESTDGYVECNLKSFKEVADILLDEMEYRGMLPPPYKTPVSWNDKMVNHGNI